MADIYGYAAGHECSICRSAGRGSRSSSPGVFRDYARQHGALLIDRADYVALTGDRRVNDGAAMARRRHDRSRRRWTRCARFPAARSSRWPRRARSASLSLRIFDRSFAVTYAMEAVAVLVGLFGLSSSLGALVLARRREFGMLRHLGLTRAADRRACSPPKAACSRCSARSPASLAGAAISLVLVFVVNRQSFNWSMELHSRRTGFFSV